MPISELKHENDASLQKNSPSLLRVLGDFVLDIGIGTTLWFFLMVLATALWVLCEKLVHGATHVSQPGPITQIVLAISTLYAAIFALWILRGRQLNLPQRSQATGSNIFFAVLMGFGLFLFTTTASYCLKHGGAELQPNNQTLLEQYARQWPIVVAVFTIIIAPAFEELFFRKQVFARFVGAGHAITGSLLSSILFALMHEPAPTGSLAAWLITLAIYTSMGALFALVYQKTGRLWVAMLAHSSNNLFAVLALLLLR